MRSFVTAVAAFLSMVSTTGFADEPAAVIPQGSFESVLPIATGKNRVTLPSFKLDRKPVTNAEFANFVRGHQEWQRGRVAKLFVDDTYLSQWESAVKPKAGTDKQPVTQVSWFAASAYCRARNARLPTWYEWEYVAAASDTKRDAREDPAWKQTMLAWYSRPAGDLPDVGKTPANLYGVQDLHGVVWEWVEDFNGMIVSGDSREQNGPDTLRFCGSGALTMEQKDQYAVLMRVAMLSSLQAQYTTSSLGFRCAEDTAQ